MSDIPDGADSVVARMAIAWEMTKKIAGRSSLVNLSDDDKIKLYLTVYNKVYEGLKGKTTTAKSR